MTVVGGSNPDSWQSSYFIPMTSVNKPILQVETIICIDRSVSRPRSKIEIKTLAEMRPEMKNNHDTVAMITLRARSFFSLPDPPLFLITTGALPIVSACPNIPTWVTVKVCITPIVPLASPG